MVKSFMILAPSVNAKKYFSSSMTQPQNKIESFFLDYIILAKKIRNLLPLKVQENAAAKPTNIKLN
jgi:hypothetical protein